MSDSSTFHETDGVGNPILKACRGCTIVVPTDNMDGDGYCKSCSPWEALNRRNTTIDELSIRIAALTEELKNVTESRAESIRILEDKREQFFELLTKVAEFEPTRKRLAAREMELERIRDHLYKNRVEDFIRDANGD